MRKRIFQIILVILITVFCLAGVSSAAEFWLRAGTFIKTMPDGVQVPMWGFARCTANFASCNPLRVPGPPLIVPPGENTLVIHVRNNLAGPYTEPVSLVIPGQAMPTDGTASSPAPVKVPDENGNLRVRSLVHETAVGSDGVYVWNALKSGTYLYQSGTHQAVQIQMGLYGPLKMDAAPGRAYTGVPFDREVMLFFSEIDPALHTAVVTNNYGPGKAMTSTMYYEPKYFLINGEPYSSATSAIPAGSAGQRVLIRFLNAGLESHVPILDRHYMSVLAEDGNVFEHPKEQYAPLLAAGKTLDAMITPKAQGTYAVYDRMLSLTNAAASPGGMLAHLRIASAPAGAASHGQR